MTASVRRTAAEPDAFVFGGWEADDRTGELRLHYRFSGGPAFCEVIDLAGPLPASGSDLRPGFDAAVQALYLAAGTSYYKAFAPPALEFEAAAPDAAQRAFFQKLYENGLAEFGHRNGLDVGARIRFAEPGPDGPAPAGARGDVPLPRRSAVLIGGGKDSLVTLEVLRGAGEPMVLFAVNARAPMTQAAAASGLPLIEVRRRIDPRLFEVNSAGALNGHVPITAILSFVAAAAAFVHGYDAIVLSNERSAEEGNLVHRGRSVNHQYSKTAEFEQDLRRYIHARIHPGLAYFSLLRPLSELHIARLMARTERYDACFTSCNKVFKIRPGEAAPRRWCGDCPKCRFTYLMLATEVPAQRLRRIFGADLLDDPAQVPGYEELTGLAGHKPWECVGELAESGAAILRLAADPVWAEAPVVGALAPRLRTKMPQPDAVWRALLTPSDAHHVPPRFKEMLDDFVERG
jgi:hypothetical protein